MDKGIQLQSINVGTGLSQYLRKLQNIYYFLMCLLAYLICINFRLINYLARYTPNKVRKNRFYCQNDVSNCLLMTNASIDVTQKLDHERSCGVVKPGVVDIIDVIGNDVMPLTQQ